MVQSLLDVVNDLLDVGEVAAKLHVSKRTVYRLSDAGRMPRPVRLGSLVRWGRQAIDEWVASGCPSCRQGVGR